MYGPVSSQPVAIRLRPRTRNRTRGTPAYQAVALIPLSYTRLCLASALLARGRVRRVALLGGPQYKSASKAEVLPVRLPELNRSSSTTQTVDPGGRTERLTLSRWLEHSEVL